MVRRPAPSTDKPLSSDLSQGSSQMPVVSSVIPASHNHGYRTVDPLKLGMNTQRASDCWIHNHGYRTVDPLKQRCSWRLVSSDLAITTVIGPWTH